MASINLPFAASGTRRKPTTGELSSGFDCGPADQSLFHWLHWWATGQIDAAIEAVGLTTDDTDLTQLAQAIGIITANTTLTIGSASYPTLDSALSWLSRKRIARGAIVTIQLPSGTTTINSSLNALTFSHPDGERVVIAGAAMIGAIPTYADFTLTGSGSSARAADNAANLTLLRSRYGSELRLTGGASLSIGSRLGGLKDLLITGDGTAVDGLSCRDGLIPLTNVAVHGFGSRNVLSTGGGGVIATNLFSFGAGGTGISADDGGIIDAGGSVVSMGCGGNGIAALSMGCIRTVGAVGLYGSGNAGTGIIAQDNGTVACPTSQSRAEKNGASGFAAIDAGRLNGSSATSSNNTTAGFFASTGGIVTAVSSTGSSNPNGLLAQNAGVMTATGSTITPVSPTANTVGNNNSIIIA